MSGDKERRATCIMTDALAHLGIARAEHLMVLQNSWRRRMSLVKRGKRRGKIV